MFLPATLPRTRQDQTIILRYRWRSQSSGPLFNAAYLQAAVKKLRAAGVVVTDDQLAHIFPTVSADMGSWVITRFATILHWPPKSMHCRCLNYRLTN